MGLCRGTWLQGPGTVPAVSHSGVPSAPGPQGTLAKVVTRPYEKPLRRSPLCAGLSQEKARPPAPSGSKASTLPAVPSASGDPLHHPLPVFSEPLLSPWQACPPVVGSSVPRDVQGPSPRGGDAPSESLDFPGRLAQGFGCTWLSKSWLTAPAGGGTRHLAVGVPYPLL